MNKFLTLTAAIGMLGAPPVAQAFNFQLDIAAGEFVAAPDGSSAFSGTVFIGAVPVADASTFDWSQPLTVIDDQFSPIAVGTFDATGNIISRVIPMGGSWPNATQTWSSQEPADWNTVFAGKDILAVFTDIPAAQGDGNPFDGEISPPDWSAVTEILVVDTETNFFDATTSSFITTAPDVTTNDTILLATGSAAIVSGTPASLATFDLIGLPYSGAEGAGVDIVIERTGVSSSAVSVELLAVDDSAVEGVDYDFSPNPLTVDFAANVTERTVTVNFPDVPGFQGDRDFTVELQAPLPDGDAELGTTTTAVVTITEGVSTTFDLSQGTYSGPDGGSVDIVIERTGDTGAAGSVELLAVADSAVEGVDYDFSPNPLTVDFAANETERTVTVDLIEVPGFQGDRDFTVELQAPSPGSALGATTTALVTITESEPAVFDLDAASYSGLDGAGVDVVVRRAGTTTTAVSVELLAVDGTAVEGTDYDFPVNPLTLGFAADQTERTVTIDFPGVPGFQGDREFEVELQGPSSGASLGAVTSATVEVIEDALNFGEVGYDAGQVAATIDVNEGDVTGNTLVLDLVRSGGTDGPVSVAFAASGDAVVGTDFTIESSPVEVANGSNTGGITITTIPNTDFQGDRTFTVTLTSATDVEGGDALGTPTVATIRIVEDDDAPPAGSISFTVSEFTGGEGDGQIALTLRRQSGESGDVSAEVTFADGTATSPADYDDTPQTVSWADGETGTKTIQVPVVDNGIQDGDRQFEAVLGTPTGDASLGSPSTATVIIEDDDLAGEFVFAGDTATVNEADGVVELQVNRSSPTNLAVDVTITSADGSAVEGTDYDAPPSPLGFAADQSVGTVSVPILDNDDADGDRTFTVTLVSATKGGVIGEPATVTVTIVDDEIPGVFSFSQDAISVAEDAGQLGIEVKRAGGSDGPAEVSLTSADGTAMSGTDYQPPVSPLGFSDGQTAGTVIVPIIDNDDLDGDRTFTVTLTGTTNGELGEPTTVTVTIVDNEVPEPGTLVFDPTSITVSETAGTVTATIRRINGSDGEVTVESTAFPGTAVPGEDYVDPGTRVSVFGDGVTEQTVSVDLIDDTVVESSKFFTLRLSNPTGGAEIGVSDIVTITVTSEDTPVTFTLNQSSFPVNEGNPVTITVISSGGQSGAQSQVNFATANGSAIAGVDYTATSGTLTFDGSGQQQVTVQTLNDDDAENDEVFFFNLSLLNPNDPSTRLGSPNQATITINRNSEGQDQPDLMVSPNGSEFAGEGVINNTGDSQIATANTRSGREVTFTVRLKNDGPIDDSFRITASPSGTADGSSVRYRIGGDDVTEEIESEDGITTGDLRSGETVDIRTTVKLRSGSQPLSGYGVTFVATSAASNAQDTAIVVGIVRQ